MLAEESGVETDYAALVRELADPATYPRLTRMVLEGQPARRRSHRAPSEEFEFDLDDHAGRVRGAAHSLTDE